MPKQITEPAAESPANRSRSNSMFQLGSVLVALAALWIPVITFASAFWRALPQYTYGWMVLVATIYFVLEALPEKDRQVNRQRPGPAWITWALIIVFGFAYLLIHPNTDWRPAIWLLTLAAIGASWSVIAACVSLSVANRCLLPMAFFLLALPWPMRIEHPLTMGLMEFAAVIATEVLNLGGILALHEGNVLRVSGAVIGVDEACSGIRSLQASLAAAVFLAVFFQLPKLRFALLVFQAAIVAIFLNTIRATILAWVVAKNGEVALQIWHDPAGWTLLSINFVLLWITCQVFKPNDLNWSGLSRLSISSLSQTGSKHLVWVYPIAIGLILLAAESWYRPNIEVQDESWDFRRPEASASIQSLPVSKEAAELLQYDYSISYVHNLPGRESCAVFFFKWYEGPIHTRILARSHRPEICLPAIGLESIDEIQTESIQVAGYEFPFHVQEFRTPEGNEVYAYFCVWETGAGGPVFPTANDWNFKARLEAVTNRQRTASQYVIQIIVFGSATERAAERVFRNELSKGLRLQMQR